MKSNTFSKTGRRRGLSTIVGALLFVVLMVSTFAVLGVALNSQSDIASTGRDVAAADLKKLQEEFTIDVFTDLSDPAELFINVNNLGPNSVEISTVLVSEITDVANNFPSTVYDIPADTSFVTPGDTSPVLPPGLIFLELADPATTGVDEEWYTIKVISSLGTIEDWTIVCDDNSCVDTGTPPGAGDLSATLFLDGPTGVNTKISTVVMFVTNTSEEIVTDVQPAYGFDPLDDTCVNPDPPRFWNYDDTNENPETQGQFVESITECNFTPSIAVDQLGPHEIAIFKWDFKVGGDIGGEFTFCNHAIGNDSFGPISSGLDTCDTLTIIDPNDCNGCGPGGDTLILIDDLLIRPSLFMIIPSPFGLSDSNDNEKGLWGVNVVNPTEKPMNLTKVTIVSYPPGANANNVVFNPGSCIIEGITPSSDWSCPGENTIMWQNLASPINIPEYSSVSFLAKVEPGSIAANAQLDALIVQANAFTTTGSFGKSSYQSTMFQNPEAMPSVFLTNATSAEDPRANDRIQSQREGLQDLVSHEFKIALADMDNNDETYIKKDSRLIINIPREWTNPIITADTGFVPDGAGPGDDRITFFNDGSYQIVAVTNVDIGGNTNLDDSLVLTFEATPPDNEGDPKFPYIMYVLADGQTGNGQQIGPLNEIFLQVVD